MSFAIYTDPKQMPVRITNVIEDIDTPNYKGIPDVIVLDDTDPVAHENFKILFNKVGRDWTYLTVVKDVPSEMGDVARGIVDAEIAAKKKVEEDARIALFDDLLFDTKPTDAALIKIFSVIDSLEFFADVKMFLKRIVVFLVKQRSPGP